MRQGAGHRNYGREPNIGIHSAPPKIDFSKFKVPILAATEWMPIAAFHVEAVEEETTCTTRTKEATIHASPRS